MSQEQTEPLKPEYICKYYRKLTDEQIRTAFSTPELTPHILSVISKLSDPQMKVAIPLMTCDQIKTAIPKLQLQQTGAAVQFMTPPQIRQTINSLTGDDRNLLLQNVALLQTSSNKDEMQSFITFIEPLALAVAVKLPDLTSRIIEVAAIMTVEQLKIVVPLLEEAEVIQTFLSLEDENQIEVVLSMIQEKKEKLTEMIHKDFERLDNIKIDIKPKLDTVQDQLHRLSQQIQTLEQCKDMEILQPEYETIAKFTKSTKTEIESIQKNIRDVQSALKLPLKLLSQDMEMYTKYKELSEEISIMAKTGHAHLARLSSSDVLTSSLSSVWQKLQPTVSRKRSLSLTSETLDNSESDGEDDSLAIGLYDAVKQIGNPESIGNYYSMTWNDIIEAGFRSLQDFKDKEISNLEKLQQYLHAIRTPSK